MKFPKSVLKDIEEHLHAEKNRVEEQIRQLSAQDPFSDTSRLTDNAATDTEAKEEIDHERYQAMLKELEDKQKGIIQALVRIDKGTYGFCTKCAAMIDTDRLAVLPIATLCMSCENSKIS